MFQEWFDITYFSDEDPMVVFNNYCSKSMSRRVSPNQNSDKLEKTAGDNNDNLNSEVSLFYNTLNYGVFKLFLYFICNL